MDIENINHLKKLHCGMMLTFLPKSHINAISDRENHLNHFEPFEKI